MGSFTYEARGIGVRVRTSQMTNHEMRAILVGMWLCLDEADRLDHIRELEHYTELESRPPEAAMAIARAYKGKSGGWKLADE